MSLPLYPEYKDSGVAWLGEVPGHWDVKALKHIAVIDNSGCYGVDQVDGEHVLPVATTAQINRAGHFDVESMPIRGFSSSEIERYGCTDGDILVVKSSGSAENIISGKAGMVTKETPQFVFSNFLMRIRPKREVVDQRYIFALIISHLTRERIKQMCSTTTYPNLQIGPYISALLPMPPLEEQQTIAVFLDRETGKIDALIAEQQRLVALLEEKRQAVISHAVTKGLNPNTKMKDSGIEWLGEVPEHWEVVPLKQVIAQIESGVSVNASDFPASETELGVLKTSCVYSGQFDANENKTVIEAELDRVSCPLKAGTLIVSRMNTPELVGAAGLVKEAPENIFLPDRLWQVSFSNAAPAFVHYWTQSVFYRAQIRVVCAGTSSSMQNLGQDQFRSFDFPNPPQVEQQTIVAYLDTETAKFDTLTAETNRAIELLQERRSALITAAVTGKICIS